MTDKEKLDALISACKPILDFVKEERDMNFSKGWRDRRPNMKDFREIERIINVK